MGTLAALGAAIFWAATNLILRGPIVRLGGATVQAWRTVVSTLVFAPAFFALRDPHALLAIPPRTVAVLLLAVFLSMVIGDILQFTAVRHLGVALTLPIASAYPLLTVPLAMATLGEVPTTRLFGGALLVVAGVTLVALPRGTRRSGGVGPPSTGTGHGAGVALALGSAACVAAATALTRAALRDVDILAANMLRLPFSAVPLYRDQHRAATTGALAGRAGKHPAALPRRADRAGEHTLLSGRAATDRGLNDRHAERRRPDLRAPRRGGVPTRAPDPAQHRGHPRRVPRHRPRRLTPVARPFTRRMGARGRVGTGSRYGVVPTRSHRPQARVDAQVATMMRRDKDDQTPDIRCRAQE